MPTKSPRRLPTDNLLYSKSYSSARILQHLTVGRCKNGTCRVLLVSHQGWASPLCGPPALASYMCYTACEGYVLLPEGKTTHASYSWHYWKYCVRQNCRRENAARDGRGTLYRCGCGSAWPLFEWPAHRGASGAGVRPAGNRAWWQR